VRPPPIAVHCSNHKCLTVYYKRVMGGLLNDTLRNKHGSYHHFNSEVDKFWAEHSRYRVASVNNQVLDLDRIPHARISRFVRDPRDLVVSGYHYHRRGAESWCNIIDPCDGDWSRVNGTVPESLAHGESFASHLQRVDVESGLIAEMDFRRRHFDSMRAFPQDPRILTMRYEEIIGNERWAFGRLLRHYDMTWRERWIGTHLAAQHQETGQSGDNQHVRDPRPGQWRQLFTPRVTAAFVERYGDLPAVLGYPD
jgi:hypothetical protein